MGYHIEARYLPSRRGGPEILSSPEEVDEFIDRLLAQPEEYNLATQGMGALKYVDSNGGFASWAPWDADSQKPVYRRRPESVQWQKTPRCRRTR